jgi:glycosyltransferase involved in cell wall biosynthesis
MAWIRACCTPTPPHAPPRAALGLGDAFVFLSVGGMFWNKGLDLLLHAFARVAEREPRVRLFLKGADAIYPSADIVRKVVGDLPARARAAAAGRILYHGETYSAGRMADLLRAADVYVAPYRAEGFAMPVLEAAACGVPVICTAGGPTDEFVDASFARRIRSAPMQRNLSETVVGDVLEPDLEHLTELMGAAVRERDDAPRAGAAAAAHVARHFTWERVTDRLLEVFWGRAP